MGTLAVVIATASGSQQRGFYVALGVALMLLGKLVRKLALLARRRLRTWNARVSHRELFALRVERGKFHLERLGILVRISRIRRFVLVFSCRAGRKPRLRLRLGGFRLTVWNNKSL